MAPFSTRSLQRCLDTPGSTCRMITLAHPDVNGLHMKESARIRGSRWNHKAAQPSSLSRWCRPPCETLSRAPTTSAKGVPAPMLALLAVPLAHPLALPSLRPTLPKWPVQDASVQHPDSLCQIPTAAPSGAFSGSNSGSEPPETHTRSSRPFTFSDLVTIGVNSRCRLGRFRVLGRKCRPFLAPFSTFH